MTRSGCILPVALACCLVVVDAAFADDDWPIHRLPDPTPMRAIEPGTEFGPAVRAIPGSATTQYVVAATVTDTTDLLPAPPDPAFILSSPFDRTPQLGSAYAIAAAPFGLKSRIGSSVKLSGAYDSGAFEDDGYGPLNVALDGTDDARRRGQFGLGAFDGLANLKFDAQKEDTSNGVHYQGFLRLDFAGDGGGTLDSSRVSARDAYFRVTGAGDDAIWDLRGGETQSFAADVSALPQSTIASIARPHPTETEESITDRSPIVGAVARSATQIAIARRASESVWVGFGVESPDADFEPVNADDVKLSRYPTLVTRMRYKTSPTDRLQIAGLARWFSRKDLAYVEDSVTGWGVCGSAVRQLNQRNVVYLGGIGGQGMGTYISGIEWGAGPGSTELQLLDSYGGYAGLAHLWSADTDGAMLWSTFATGYAYQGDSLGLPGSAMRRSRQAMANLLYRLNDNFAIGIEYQYLDRRVKSGLAGENQRVQLTMYFATPDPPVTQARRSTTAFTTSPPSQPGTTYLRDL